MSVSQNYPCQTGDDDESPDRGRRVKLPYGPGHETLVLNPESATYNLQQTTISNITAFSKITNKA